MSKNCIICGESKLLDDFPSRKNQCKTCKYKRDAVLLKARKTTDDSLISIDEELRNLIVQLQKLPIIAVEPSSSVSEKYTKLRDTLLNALVSVDIMSDKTKMILKMKIPEALHKFLTFRSGDTRSFASLKTAIMYLSDSQFENGFEKHFGMSRDSLTLYVPLLKDLDMLTGFIGAAYYGLIDEYLSTANSKFVNAADHVSDHELRKNVGIRFDPATDAIVADGNPLKIDGNAFMIGLARLVETEHFNVMGYKVAGYYDKLKNLMCS